MFFIISKGSEVTVCSGVRECDNLCHGVLWSLGRTVGPLLFCSFGVAMF